MVVGFSSELQAILLLSTENASIKMILINTLMVSTAPFPPLDYSQHTVNSATCGVEVVVGFSSELRRTLLLSTENTSYYELDSVFTQ